MGIRSTVASLIGGDQVESRLRDIVEGIVAAKGFARPSDLQELRERLDGLGGETEGGGASDSGLSDRVQALETDNASLRKKLDLLRGAVDAATAQLADVRRSVDLSRAESAKALARAESALATAESLSEGIDALESAVGEPAPAQHATADRRLDLNQVTADALEQLPGIGPSMAYRIVQDREANGPFHKVADLSRVKGMGAATVKKLDESLRV